MLTVTSGMYLEAIRREDYPDEIGLAVVKEIDEKGRLLVAFDTPDDKSSYWASIVDDNLYPYTYCHASKLNLRGGA